ncbi:MAG: hypothetical protein ACK4NS_08065 [Saprospiraceae bacterium]
MITITLIGITFVLMVVVVKSLIEIIGLLLKLNKDVELNKAPNPFERNYQFIKGLY